MLSVGQCDLSFLTLTAPSPVRDLNTYLDSIWQRHFPDIPRINEVQIAYSYPWKRRLGLIRLSLDNTTSFIGINALLQHLSLPEHVLITTVAHELAHYAHGFGSPLPRLYQHPHANNVVNRELEQRGLGELLRLCDEWIDKQWLAFYQLYRNPHLHNLQGARKGITCPPGRVPVPQTGCPYYATNGAESRPQRTRHSYHHISPLSVENFSIELPCIFCVYEGSALRCVVPSDCQYVID